MKLALSLKLGLPVLSLAMLAAGCQNNKPEGAASLNSLSPTPMAATATPIETASLQAPTAPMVIQTPSEVTPIETATPPVMADLPSSASAQGSRYTVKPGDTLYRIAATHYGSGGQWKKIADANPGLSPSKLRVGQTITLP